MTLEKFERINYILLYTCIASILLASAMFAKSIVYYLGGAIIILSISETIIAYKLRKEIKYSSIITALIILTVAIIYI